MNTFKHVIIRNPDGTWDELDDYVINNEGVVKSLKYDKERVLKYGYDRDGYKKVNLSIRKVKSCSVHNLVLNTFRTDEVERHPDYQCDHINQDRTDNRLCNLQFVDKRENMMNRTNNTYLSNISLMKVSNKKTGQKRYTYWHFQIKGAVPHSKTFYTLKECILYRNDFYEEHGLRTFDNEVVDPENEEQLKRIEGYYKD